MTEKKYLNQKLVQSYALMNGHLEMQLACLQIGKFPNDFRILFVSVATKTQIHSGKGSDKKKRQKKCFSPTDSLTNRQTDRTYVAQLKKPSSKLYR